MYLLVDEVCADGILAGGVPRSEDLLSEEQPPWSVPLLRPHLFGVLLTLGDGVHDVVVPTAQGGHLDVERQGGREG